MKSSTISPQGYKVTIEMFRETDGAVIGPWHVKGIVDGYPNLRRLYLTGKPFNIFLFDSRLSGPIFLDAYLGSKGHFINKGPIRSTEEATDGNR